MKIKDTSSAKKVVIHAIKDLVLTMTIKKYHTVKNHCIIAIKVKNIEELLIIFVI